MSANISTAAASIHPPSHVSCSTYIQYRKNDISPPTHILNRQRRDLQNQKVTNSIRRRRNTRPLLPQPQRQYLRRVNPDRSLEANSEGAFEQEQHDRARNTRRVRDLRLILDLVDESRLGGHDERHDRNHRQEERAPADTVDEEPRDEPGDEEPELQEAGHEGREVGAEADVSEEGRRVVDDGVYTA